MEYYQIIYPSAQLAPYVKLYWFLQTDALTSPTQRLIPTGCHTLTFHRASPLFAVNGSAKLQAGMLGGISTKFDDYSLSGATDIVCVLFEPFGVAPFMRMTMNEVANAQIPVYDLGSPMLKELQSIIMDEHDNMRCVKAIERTLVKLYDERKDYLIKRIGHAVGLIDGGEQNVNRLAAESCQSVKSFRRNFSQLVGVNPKEFIEIIRFQRALHTMQHAGTKTLTQIAYNCGYADQAHMTREFIRLSGYSPRELLQNFSPYSDYFA